MRAIDSYKNEMSNLENEKAHKEQKHSDLKAKFDEFLAECMDMSEDV